MPKTFFRFKHFTIHQDQCAMKVGTDGVLLGAWANVDNRNTILDVGTGTGLIALMVAQRNPQAHIDAVEIDMYASHQALKNVKRSLFGKQIDVYNENFRKFALSTTTKYNLIVCNPPFFENSLKSSDEHRNVARHNELLSLNDLIGYAADILIENGTIAVILPLDNFEKAINIALKNGLFLTRRTNVKPLPHSLPKRVLLEFSNRKTSLIENEIVIELSRHCYSEAYKTLTKDFYRKH